MDALDLVGSYLDAQNGENVVVYRSLDGKTGWKPIPLAEVPMWLREPDVIEHLLGSNQAASNPAEGPGHYTMMRVSQIQAIKRGSQMVPSRTQH